MRDPARTRCLSAQPKGQVMSAHLYSLNNAFCRQTQILREKEKICVKLKRGRTLTGNERDIVPLSGTAIEFVQRRHESLTHSVTLGWTSVYFELDPPTDQIFPSDFLSPSSLCAFLQFSFLLFFLSFFRLFSLFFVPVSFYLDFLSLVFFFLFQSLFCSCILSLKSNPFPQHFFLLHFDVHFSFYISLFFSLFPHFSLPSFLLFLILSLSVLRIFFFTCIFFTPTRFSVTVNLHPSGV